MKVIEKIWKRIPGYPYEASPAGEIRSVRSGKILKQRYEHCGYKRVNFSVNGIHETKLVHLLVAEAFFGPKEDNRTQVNHIDGNKDNCSASNLEYCTPSENTVHAFAIGLRAKGSDHGMAKLNEEKVREILLLYKSGCSKASISRLYGISDVHIGKIVNREFWKHVS